MIRLSAIPSHFSTAVFAACDVKFWHFAVATFLALPKQVVLVYLGVLLVQQESGGSAESSRDTTIKTVVFGATFVVTILLGIYIWRKMRVIKKTLLAEQDARRSAKVDLLRTPETAMQQQQQVYPLQLVGALPSATKTHRISSVDQNQNPDSRFDRLSDEESAIGQAVTTYQGAYHVSGYAHLPVISTVSPSPSPSPIQGYHNQTLHDSRFEERGDGDVGTPSNMHPNPYTAYQLGRRVETGRAHRKTPSYEDMDAVPATQPAPWI